MNCSLPNGFWGFAWDPCARVRRFILARHCHILKREPFPGKLKELQLLEIFPWLSEPGLDTLDHLGNFGPKKPISVSYIFLFNKPFKKMFVCLRYVLIYFVAQVLNKTFVHLRALRIIYLGTKKKIIRKKMQYKHIL